MTNTESNVQGSGTRHGSSQLIMARTCNDMGYPRSKQHLQVQLFSTIGTSTWECGTTTESSSSIIPDTIESTSSPIVTRVKPIQNLSAFI